MSENNTLEDSRKILQILKLFGFSSITIVEGKSVTKLFDVLCFIFAVSIGVFSLLAYITHRKELEMSQSDIANYGNFIMMITAICVAIIAMTTTFIFRHKIWSMIVRCVEVDENVRKSVFTEMISRFHKNRT